MVSWITTVNVFLVLVILTASVSVPDYSGKFTDEVEEERKNFSERWNAWKTYFCEIAHIYLTSFSTLAETKLKACNQTEKAIQNLQIYLK
jgi:hypothetical protein